MRAIDEWSKRVEIDLYNLVVLSTIVWTKIGRNLVGCCSNFATAGCTQVITHVAVVTKDRTCCANLGTHVADGGFTCCRNAVGTRPEVFSNGSGAAFNSELTSNFQNHIFRAAPAGKSSGELDANNFWPTNVEGKSGHDIDCVGAAHSNGHHAKSTSVWCVAIGTNHHSAGECVVFKNHLVNDSAAWPPETNAVLCAD
ncbi:unannotated protein [freshwater metagenome]|uniref:Unannotated protein n=1 Tax=freshwater metagenome TaxID=449393 RepID=A0A6J6GMJ3_9ZZZZ